jgi:AAA15 family ATPase/GTPase
MDDIARINLVAGVNNVGKTALLEALYLHSGAYNPELAMRIDVFRGIESRTVEFARWFKPPWDDIFNEFDTTRTIEFVGKYKNGRERSLRLRAIRSPEELTEIYRHFVQTPDKQSEAVDDTNLSSGAHVLQLDCVDESGKHNKYHYIIDRRGTRVFPIPPTLSYQTVFMPARLRFLAEDVKRFSELRKSKRQNMLVEALRTIEPRLKSLDVVIEDNLPLIQGDIGIERLVPLPLMGEGMTRLASVVLTISAAQDGVALIDEIENGFHHSVLPKVWRLVAEAARIFNTQIFTTTHSLECIVAAHRAFGKGRAYEFRLHRLEAVQNKIRAISYDKGALSAAIDAGLEVR